MTRMVNCVHLGREAEGLERPTYPGALGVRIYEHISKEAWGLWLKQQTMFINEYRLSTINAKDRKFLQEEMEKFFFGEGASTIDNFKPV